MKLNVNGKDVEVDAKDDELLVWVIHEKVGLTQTRFGCGMGMCGSCKLLLDGEVTKSCQVNACDAVGKKIETSESNPDIKEMQ